MKIRYSPAARDDLRELRLYITSEFGAVVAAKSLGKIVSDIRGDEGTVQPYTVYTDAA